MFLSIFHFFSLFFDHFKEEAQEAQEPQEAQEAQEEGAVVQQSLTALSEIPCVHVFDDEAKTESTSKPFNHLK